MLPSATQIHVNVFPARAGMILRWSVDGRPFGGIPRESGDDPVVNMSFYTGV